MYTTRWNAGETCERAGADISRDEACVDGLLYFWGEEGREGEVVRPFQFDMLYISFRR